MVRGSHEGKLLHGEPRVFAQASRKGASIGAPSAAPILPLSPPPSGIATLRPSPGCPGSLHRFRGSEATGCRLAPALFDIVKQAPLRRVPVQAASLRRGLRHHSLDEPGPTLALLWQIFFLALGWGIHESVFQ